MFNIKSEMLIVHHLNTPFLAHNLRKKDRVEMKRVNSSVIICN